MDISNFDAIIFDFDGVIVDSEQIRINGFKKIFQNQPDNLVDKLIDYHIKNGGISRYEKIKWFYRNFLDKEINEFELNSIADEFKNIMIKEMINPKIIICETFEFIKKFYKEKPLSIISGSDHKELNIICKSLNLSKYFKSIEGSPIKKVDLISNFISRNKYINNRILYIGDSLIDLKCSRQNNIKFFGYNNHDLISGSDFYINKFNSLI